MTSLTFFFTLVGCITLGAIGFPILQDGSLLAKRGLEVTDGQEIVLVGTGKPKNIATVSPDDQKTIDTHTERMKARNIPYISAIHAYYNYAPLAKGKEPTTRAEIDFWPPKVEDKQQQETMKTKLDAAKTQWKNSDTYKNLKKSLDELSEDITVSKIFGLGCGSLNRLNPFSEVAQTETQERSYIQTAIILTIQEDLKSGPQLVLQDPTYGETEIDYLKKSTSGSIQFVNDPDGFDAIDDKTIVLNIGGYDSFWYRINKGPTPIAIISESLDTAVGGEEMLKPQLDLLSKYNGEEIAAIGVAGLGTEKPTKFWRRSCD